MYLYRLLSAGDLELVCDHRARMFREAGHDEDAVCRMTRHFRGWLTERLAVRGYVGTVAEVNGKPIASVGLTVVEWPARASYAAGPTWRGHLLSLFVEPEHRGRGVATRLMRLAEAELAARGVRYSLLHATRAARAMYERIGLPLGRAEGGVRFA